MDSEKISHAMSRSVAEIKSFTPQRKTCGRIYPASGSPRRENSRGQAYMSLEDKRIVPTLKLGAWSKRNGAGDICGAAEELAPGIVEIQPAWIKTRCALCGSVIVRERRGP